MSAIKISKENFDTVVMDSKKPVLLDFYADRCPHCRSISPIIDQIASERSDITVGKINVDEEKELASRYDVMSIPALLVIKDGKTLKRSVGAKPKSAILDMLL